MTFSGSFEHSVDERGRIAIPSKYRKELQPGDGVVLRSNADGCIELYTSEGFEAEFALRQQEQRSTREVTGRRIRRAFLANAYDVELDGQGRVLVPQGLRDEAALRDRATIVGCGEYIEIWNPQRWEAELAAIAAEQRHALGGDGTGDQS